MNAGNSLNLQGDLNDLIKASLESPTSLKAIIEIHRTDISKFPPFSLEVDIESAKRINASKNWEEVKLILGEYYGDDITDVSIRIPLKKKGSEYFLRLFPDRKPFVGTLSTVEC